MTNYDTRNHECFSEDFLIENLPVGWSYDCTFGGPDGPGFLIIGPGDANTSDRYDHALFIPLRFLKG